MAGLAESRRDRPNGLATAEPITGPCAVDADGQMRRVQAEGDGDTREHHINLRRRQINVDRPPSSSRSQSVLPRH